MLHKTRKAVIERKARTEIISGILRPDYVQSGSAPDEFKLF